MLPGKSEVVPFGEVVRGFESNSFLMSEDRNWWQLVRVEL